jgi:hypothetical protein
VKLERSLSYYIRTCAVSPRHDPEKFESVSLDCAAIATDKLACALERLHGPISYLRRLPAGCSNLAGHGCERNRDIHREFDILPSPSKRSAAGLAQNKPMSEPTPKLPQEGIAERCNRDSLGFGHNLHEQGAAATPLLADPESAFARNYNRKTFSFAHGLAGHPLFELDALIELSLRMADHRDTYWSNGRVKVDNGWSAGTTVRTSLQDTIANIATNDSMVILKHTEQDPVHGPVLQEFLGRVVQLAGEQMRCDVTIGETLILISSPNRVTPYHMDAETNFLVQVRGNKWFHVFDQDNRDIISDFEREQYFAGDISSAVWKEECQKHAVTFDLHAGHGVHVPTGAPHWVQNKNNVSVAISVNYELRSVERLKRIYRFNHRLRRVGIAPRPPGESAVTDAWKSLSSSALSHLRSLARSKSGEPQTAVWSPPA